MVLGGLAGLLLQLNPHNTGNRDFIQYWSAAKILLHGGNPYYAGAIASVERSAGLTIPPILIWNTPYILPLLLPLGLFSAKWALVLWLLLLVACLIISVRIVRDLYGAPRNRLHLIGYCFAPVVACLFAGQVSIFALLGLVLFLKFYRDRPFLAGLALSLCAVKPQLFFAYGIALLVWIVLHKQHRIPLGAVLAISLWVSISLLIDPAAWTEYGQLARASGVDTAPVPAVSVFLRMAIAPESFALQFLLSACACVWAAFNIRKRSWDWLTDGSQMFVSVWSAPTPGSMTKPYFCRAFSAPSTL